MRRCTSASAGSITIDIRSIGSPAYTAGTDVEMKIAEANSIVGFNASYFTLDDSNFYLSGGTWTLVNHDQALWLISNIPQTPEPSTYVMGFGLLIFLGRSLWVRKKLKAKHKSSS